MYLEKLELLGFKSFAQKTTLKFSPGITAVVGPNGSGKSNIADAIRWVLGEQSMKTLRGKKSEDVIFSGSKKKSRLGLAEVALYLNNEDSQMPIDYSNVVIARKLTRSGETDYLTNNNRVRLLDVQDLLSEAGFGQKTYSVIGQGMIDTLIYAGPHERLEMFEEAAGIKSYQIKRHQAFLKLKATKQNLIRIKDILKELAPRLGSLKRQASRAQKKEETQRKLKELQIKFFNHQWNQLENKLSGFDKRCSTILQEKEKLQKIIQETRDEIARREKEIHESKTQELVRAQQEELYNQRNKLKESLAVMRGRIQIEEEREAASSSSPRTNLLPLLKKVQSSLKEIYQVQEDFQERLHKCKDLTSLEYLKSEAKNLTTRIQDLMTEIDKNTQKEKSKSHQKLDLVNEKNKIEKKIENLDKEVDQLKEKLSQENKKQGKAKQTIFDLERNLRQTQDKLEDLKDKLREEEVEKARFVVQRDNLQSQIQSDLELESLDNLFSDFKKKPQKLSLEEEEEARDQIERMKRRLIQIGEIDPQVTKEFEECQKRHSFLSGQYEDLKKASLSLKKIISELDQTAREQFNEAFLNINKKFQEYFKILFGGGRAKLIKQIVNSQQESDSTIFSSEGFAEGEQQLDNPAVSPYGESAEGRQIYIDIKATPPGKKLKSLAMLSGGEKALTSIALLFAIIANNPSPFIVLDEVDAALDEANSQRYAKILESLSSKTQFIVITHNRETMKKAKVLYGVTMGEDGVSKLLSVKLDKH